MKIATFNVNDVKKRLANLLGWLRRARPDVACLQELKATDSEFPIAVIKKAGYGAIWRGQKSWNGVAILGWDCEPVVTRTRLPGDPEDRQSRYIEAAVNGVLIATIYFRHFLGRASKHPPAPTEADDHCGEKAREGSLHETS
jgi:exodeoxyribonuclease-3